MMITKILIVVIVGSNGSEVKDWEDNLMAKPKDKTIVIVVYRGLVSEVKNVPPGWDYEIDDRDVLIEEEEPGIPPHSPGKFEASGDIGKQLHEITLEGGHDEELGSVQDFGWYALIINTKISGVPHAILWEDSQGFIEYSSYETEIKAREGWKKLLQEAEKFYAAEDL